MGRHPGEHDPYRCEVCGGDVADCDCPRPGAGPTEADLHDPLPDAPWWWTPALVAHGDLDASDVRRAQDGMRVIEDAVWRRQETPP